MPSALAMAVAPRRPWAFISRTPDRVYRGRAALIDRRPSFSQLDRGVHVHQAINVCNRTDIKAYFGDATAYAGHCAIRRNGERKTVKYLTILCLSLGLAGCYGTGPYASANGNGPVVDFSACAEAPNTKLDPLCHPLRRTQLK